MFCHLTSKKRLGVMYKRIEGGLGVELHDGFEDFLRPAWGHEPIMHER